MAGLVNLIEDDEDTTADSVQLSSAIVSKKLDDNSNSDIENEVDDMENDYPCHTTIKYQMQDHQIQKFLLDEMSKIMNEDEY